MSGIIFLHPRLHRYGFILAASVFLTVGYLALSTWETLRLETSRRMQLVEITNSFVSVFADVRGVGSVVPATFRRIGIEHFSEHKTHSDEMVPSNLRMPGRPGFEIETIETDERIQQIIQSFADDPSLDWVNEHRLTGNVLVGRSLYPVIAKSPECVSCHNEVLGEGTYQIGDVMGAFVVESDLTEAIWNNVAYAGFVFPVGLCLFGLLALREGRRRVVVENLETTVRSERDKTAAEAHAKFLMSHDFLTGLPNRTMFAEKMAAELAGPNASKVLVGLVDLDEFKAVNDTFGHAGGDALLAEVARRLSQNIAASGGFVARLGGDEFSFVLSGCPDESTPQAVAIALIAAIKGPFVLDGVTMQPMCSVGIAQAEFFIAPNASDLMKAADAALYAAKSDGRNTFRIFDENVSMKLARRMRIISHLDSAITKGEVRAVFQPKVNLATGAFVGFEALARWRLGDEELAPLEFIPIAEEVGLIRALDLGVLHAAALFSVAQEQVLGSPVPISVNVSAQSFQSENLIRDIRSILAQTCLLPERLTLEITESTAVKNWERMQWVLEEFRNCGVSVSLDDFGTGFSSLSYLRKLSFEEIKIDRHFITDIVRDDETRFLFECIVGMVKGLGSSVVVEGIESEEQARLISAGSAMIGQGYYYSKPLELNDAIDFLRCQPSTPVRKRLA
jgi:diguanylate cyclase (GGDEF)-like protein